MCRVCGSMVRCLYDITSMPSRTLTQRILSRSTVQPSLKRKISTQQPRRQPISPKSRRRPYAQPAPFTIPLRQKLHSTPVDQADVLSMPNADPLQNIDAPMLTTFDPSSISKADADTDILLPTTNQKPLVISKSLQELLPALTSQTPHYIQAHIHKFPYLLTKGDTVRLPTNLGFDLAPGTILRLNRASILGSRDYTLKAGSSSSPTTNLPHVRGEAFVNKRRTGETNYIDDRLFECRARVMGIDSGPMMITEKKKRRNRHLKTSRNKMKYTVLKVMEVRVKTLEELIGLREENQLVLE